MARTYPKLVDLQPIDARLRAMFADIEALPIPSRLLSVIDQLDEPDLAPKRATARRS